MIISQKLKKISIMEGPLRWWDYLIFALIGVFCFLSFQHGDILHTAGSSIGYLHGHILDFYDYNAEVWGIYDSYLPSSYILFAIWNIPIYLLGIVSFPTTDVPFVALMWYKLFPTILYMVCGYLIYKICTQIGMGSKKSKICVYAFYTTPICFFSQFIFGQYDVLTLLFMLLGIYYYFKGRNGWFIFFFSMSIPFKYFSFLIFLPLLLLKQKNVWKVAGSCALVMLPYLIEILIYLPSEVFREYVFGFSPAGYIFGAVIDTGYFQISWVVLVFAFTCAWAYFRKVGDMTDWAQWAFFLCSVCMFAAFGLSMWHPQWLLMGMPFFLISAFMNRDTKIFMILDLILMLLFVIFTVNYWKDRVDQFLFSLGIFKHVMRDFNVGTKITMREIFRVTDMNFVMSAFSTLLLISAVFKHPKFCAKDINANVDNCIGWIRTRFVLGVAFFVVPAWICFIAALIPPYVTINTGVPTEGIGQITNSVSMTQGFVPEQGRLKYITFRIGTYGRENESVLYVKLVDTVTGETLKQVSYDASKVSDNEWLIFDTQDMEVEVGREYRLIFTSNADLENSLTLYRTKNMGLEKNCYAMINDTVMDYQICMIVYENKK